MTLSITTSSIMILCTKIVFVSLIINDPQHNVLSVILNVVMLSVVEPREIMYTEE